MDPEEMHGYDPGERTIFDPETRLPVPLDSEEGQQIVVEVRQRLLDDLLSEQFENEYHDRFLSPTDPVNSQTPGCIAYWVNMWFASEGALIRASREGIPAIIRNAISLLGIDETDAQELMTPSMEEVYEHASSADAARMLKSLVQTGTMSWNEVLADRADPGCRCHAA